MIDPVKNQEAVFWRRRSWQCKTTHFTTKGTKWIILAKTITQFSTTAMSFWMWQMQSSVKAPTLAFGFENFRSPRRQKTMLRHRKICQKTFMESVSCLDLPFVDLKPSCTPRHQCLIGAWQKHHHVQNLKDSFVVAWLIMGMTPQKDNQNILTSKVMPRKSRRTQKGSWKWWSRSKPECLLDGRDEQCQHHGRAGVIQSSDFPAECVGKPIHGDVSKELQRASSRRIDNSRANVPLRRWKTNWQQIMRGAFHEDSSTNCLDLGGSREFFHGDLLFELVQIS